MPGAGPPRDHPGPRPHDHEPPDRTPAAPAGSRLVRLERDVLERNARIAAENRGRFAARGVLVLNLVSSPGAGKTTLLERTVARLGGRVPLGVIEGDQATAIDAERIRAAGCRAVQVTTGTGCHLDAAMVARASAELAPPAGSVVFVENVGNLVCPALFDLGERAKVLIGSVTEGEDKPSKYPHVFRAADLLLLNKIDLLPHVPFDVARYRARVHAANPRLAILETSAARGDGLDAWCRWIVERVAASPPAEPVPP